MRRVLPSIALALLACAGRSLPAAPHGGDRHAAEAAMIAADEAFSAAAVARDAEAFARLVAPDAVFFTARGLRQGREAVVESWRPFLTDGGPVLRWASHRAEASAAGDLGFTVGRWELSGDGETATGQYLTVWRRGEDGQVQAALDGTYLDASAEAPAPGAAPIR
jgi:ketosteroid isomerase-like protein